MVPSGCGEVAVLSEHHHADSQQEPHGEVPEGPTEPVEDSNMGGSMDASAPEMHSGEDPVPKVEEGPQDGEVPHEDLAPASPAEKE